MKEVKGDFWKFAKYADAICVTTNGVVKANGELVMGKGIALQFAQRWPRLPMLAGQLVEGLGNHVHYVAAQFPEIDGTDHTVRVVTFPTKHHWRDKSDLNLIIQSAKELVKLANGDPTSRSRWEKVLLTRPGCGNGGLDWEREVKPAIQNILDDRFVIVSPNQ